MRGEIHVDPSILRPGTVGLRRAVLADTRNAALIRRIESYALHERDLDDALTVITALSEPSSPLGGPAASDGVRRLAIEGAITAYFRCFDSQGRTCLADDKVLKGEPDGLAMHRYWRALRHRHVAHDSIPWCQAQVLVEIDVNGRAQGIHTLMFTGSILEAASIAGFQQLLTHTLAWVRAHMEEAESELHDVVTALDAAELVALPEPTWTAPTAEDADKQR